MTAKRKPPKKNKDKTQLHIHILSKKIIMNQPSVRGEPPLPTVMNTNGDEIHFAQITWSKFSSVLFMTPKYCSILIKSGHGL